jgi:ATP-dependent Clp protease protease subunit
MATRKVDTENIMLLYDKGIYLPTRTITLIGEINRDSAEATIKGLHMLGSLSSEPISILLNSDGGDVNQGLAIMDMIRRQTAHVTVDVYGEACSMAAVILQAADTRRMAPTARLMIHVGSESYDDHVHIVRRWAKYIAKEDKICTDKLLDRIREKHVDFSRGKLNKMLEFDTILNAEEAVKLGLADEVIK